MTPDQASAEYVEDRVGHFVLVTRTRDGVETVDVVDVGPRPVWSMAPLPGRVDSRAVRYARRVG